MRDAHCAVQTVPSVLLKARTQEPRFLTLRRCAVTMDVQEMGAVHGQGRAP